MRRLHHTMPVGILHPPWSTLISTGKFRLATAVPWLDLAASIDHQARTSTCCQPVISKLFILGRLGGIVVSSSPSPLDCLPLSGRPNLALDALLDCGGYASQRSCFYIGGCLLCCSHSRVESTHFGNASALDHSRPTLHYSSDEKNSIRIFQGPVLRDPATAICSKTFGCLHEEFSIDFEFDGFDVT